VLTWLLPNRLFLSYPVTSVLMLAIPSLVLAVLGSAHFLRPKPTAKTIWLCASATGFTMFVGLVMLLLFQQLAEASLSWKEQHLHGSAAGLEQILKLIGHAYRARGSENLLGQLFGNIMGVGLCEELIKLLPLFIFLGVVKHRSHDMCRACLAIGFFSGLGFGMGEALYGYAPWSSDLTVFTDGNITRWFACVPSHAVYTVIDAAFLWVLVPRIRAARGMYTLLGLCGAAALAIAVLHGVYNTLRGLPLAGIILDGFSLILDGFSIILMWYIANHAYARTPVSAEGLGPLSGAVPKIATRVISYQTGARKFVGPYVVATAMVVASLFLSTSEETIQAIIEQYRQEQEIQLPISQPRGDPQIPVIGTLPPGMSDLVVPPHHSRCLECGGYGQVTDPFTVGGGSPPRRMPCTRCRGSGVDPQY